MNEIKQYLSEIGSIGGLKGGLARTRKKRMACKKNAAKARAAKAAKRKERLI